MNLTRYEQAMKILRRRKRPMTSKELSGLLSVTGPNASAILRVLAKRALVEQVGLDRSRRGRPTVMYSAVRYRHEEV